MPSTIRRSGHLLAYLALLALLALPDVAAEDAVASERDRVHTANWSLAEKWHPSRIFDRIPDLRLEPQWVEDTDLFWYRYKTSEGIRYWIVDPSRKSREPLFDRMALASALTRLTGKPHDGRNLELEEVSVEPATGSLRFDLGDARFEYRHNTGTLVRLEREKKPAKEEWQNISPDGELAVFARGNNLYVTDLAGSEGKETQITFDGEKGLSWGHNWDLIENDDTESRFVDVTWSPDSRRFCVLRADVRKVGDLWLVDHLNQPRPALKTYKVPMPGEENLPRWELWVFHREGNRMIRIEAERFEDQTLSDLLEDNQWWSRDSEILYFTRRSRDYKKVDLCKANPATGESETLIEERLDAMVYLRPLIEIPGTGELLWWSMRDGWGHYYLYDGSGTLKNQVTRGPFHVERIAGLDSKSRVLFVLAGGREEGRNPYYLHLYRVNLDGSGMQLLTPEDAEHESLLSPSRRYFLDGYSRVDLPTESVLRDSQGRLLLHLESADVSRLVEAGWKPPIRFTAKSADGVTDQWGVLYAPFDLDPGRKYPVITRVYPGRQDEFIPKDFWPVNIETYLAQLGFIVVHTGNRGGSPHRGLAYREYQREDFRDYGLPDKKAVLEQLADRYPFIDIERAGIFGGSSGGFMTVSAMLVYPDFFKAGVAMAAPNDPRIYFSHWVERYHGVKKVQGEDGTEHWEANADGNLELAGKLKGRLLMIHGAQDDNVHPVHLFRMADALIKEGKRFDMFIVPGANHGLGD